MPLTDYNRFQHQYAGFDREVLYRGRGRGVVLMHELYGVTPEHIALGDRLANDGFAVFVPVLFGDPGTRSSPARALARCVSRDFRCLASNESSPITDWLRSLCGVVLGYCDGPAVGAVGMCLTGGFVLSMMIEPSVAAPVICQPAFPLVTPVRLGFDSAQRGALGVSYRDLIDAKQRHAEGVGLLGMRYSTDKICPRERMDRLEREFPNMKRIELPATDPKHSTLTHDFSQLAYDELLKFLRGNLLQ